MVSAGFHYLGPALAVLLFAHLDLLGVAWLRRASFALLLSILPASATVVGVVVLAQLPTAQDLVGVALVITAVAYHREPEGEPWSTHGSAARD